MFYMTIRICMICDKTIFKLDNFEMYKNLIIVTISCVIGLFLCYIIGVSYYYININKDRPYHFKNTKSLEFHKKYTSKIHHLSGLNWDKKN